MYNETSNSFFQPRDLVRTSSINANITLSETGSNETSVITSVNNNNSIQLSLPSDPEFKSSYTVINVTDIETHPFSINESFANTLGAGGIIAVSEVVVQSYKFPGSCKITNVSFYGERRTSTADFFFEVYNATVDGTHQYRPYKTLDTEKTNYTYARASESSLSVKKWLSNKMPFALNLNSSKTVNNIWFIGVTCGLGSLRINQATDPARQNHILWNYNDGSSGNWAFITPDLQWLLTYDAIERLPTPSEYDLEINETNVQDLVSNTGYFESVEEFDNNLGTVEFYLNATKYTNITATMNATSQFQKNTADVTIHDVIENSENLTITVSEFEADFYNKSITVSVDGTYDDIFITSNSLEMPSSNYTVVSDEILNITTIILSEYESKNGDFMFSFINDVEDSDGDGDDEDDDIDEDENITIVLHENSFHYPEHSDIEDLISITAALETVLIVLIVFSALMIFMLNRRKMFRINKKTKK